MSNRERKRSERRKRKQRSATRAAEPEAQSANGDGPGTETVSDIAAEAEARGVSKSEIRNERAREALEPLEEGQRPTVVTVGAILSAAIAAITLGAWIAGAKVNGVHPKAIQVFAPSILFGVMAWGMWGARYWAVLGFQAVMGILMVGSFLSLIGATSLAGALTALLILAIAGALFWFTVKALARIQMPDRHMPK